MQHEVLTNRIYDIDNSILPEYEYVLFSGMLDITIEQNTYHADTNS